MHGLLLCVCVYAAALHTSAPQLQSELRQWANDPPEGAVLEQCEPVTSWGILIQGPDTVDGTNFYSSEIYR